MGAGVGLEVPDLGLRMDVALGLLSPVSESRVSFEEEAFDVVDFAFGEDVAFRFDGEEAEIEALDLVTTMFTKWRRSRDVATGG